jgi:hypothetical protein
MLDKELNIHRRSGRLWHAVTVDLGDGSHLSDVPRQPPS